MPFKKFRTASSARTAVLSLFLTLIAACSSRSGDTGKSYAMGEAAIAGPLTYTVVESEWRSSLDGAMGQRPPKNQFLLVHVTVADKGDAEVGVPVLSLIDANGAEIREEEKGEGVSEWLGYLRRVGPGETLNGRIVFDVPQAGYKLRISSGGAADTETTAVVEIPFRAESPAVRGADQIAVPPAK